MKYLSILIVFSFVLFSCGGGETTNQNQENNTTPNEAKETKETAKSTTSPESYDSKRGEGKFTDENLNLAASLDATLSSKGKDISDVKCTSCHKVTEERLVGPGWKGITQRRRPAWIMNFITNPDPMIDKDPELQAQLEICLVRMPNQNIAEEEARAILEFMRQNDGLK